MREGNQQDKTSTNERYRVQSLGRALDLLELLGKAGRDGGRLTDLANELSLSKAAIYAILQTYLARGFISAIGEGPTKRYGLGMSLARLGDIAISNIALADIAMPILRALTREVRLTSRVAILDDGYTVVVGRVDAPGAVRFDAALGRRELPHSSAAGKSMLAALPRAQAVALLNQTSLPRLTPHTVTSLAALQSELDSIVTRGYAVDDEENAEVVSIGTCVFDRTGNAVGALSVTGLQHSSSNDQQEQLATTLIRYADQLSRHIGGLDGREAWTMRRCT